MVWWDYGPSGPWDGMTFGPIVMILALIMIVLASFGLTRSITSETTNHNKSK
jgi:hypothetical protein